ncbi:MAG: replicative DNA helicase [Thermoleophilia bacterium]|nr:replicative DNA helicase [Thermoleophilia bacterium]
MTKKPATAEQKAADDARSQIVPQNLEAEEAALGAMLMSPRAIEVGDDIGLRSSHFYRPSHQMVFDAIKALAVTSEVDTLTVINELRRNGNIEEVGGPIAVVSLAERVPADANCRAYIQEVVDHAVYRRLVDAGHMIASLGYDHPATTQQMITMAAEIVSTLDGPEASSGGTFTALGDLVGGLYDSMLERYEAATDFSGLSTGFTAIDKFTGGLRPGNVYIIAARPGMGKTSLLLNIIAHIALELQVSVGMFSLEMSQEDLVAKVVASLAKVDANRLTNTRPLESDFELVSDAIKVAQAKGANTLLFDDAGTLSSFDIRARARRLARQQLSSGRPALGAVAVDYMQLVEQGMVRNRNANREQEISKVSRDLLGMAKELHVPVIALSQLSRANESRENKRPKLSDLRESGAIEQDATSVMFLHRQEYYDKDDLEMAGKAEVIFGKNRYGPQNVTAWLGWLAKYTKFVNFADAEPPAPTPKYYNAGMGGAGVV